MFGVSMGSLCRWSSSVGCAWKVQVGEVILNSYGKAVTEW